MFNNAPLSEPVAVPDIFATGIAHIENLGNGIIRFTLYAGHLSLPDNAPERVIVAKIVIARSDVLSAILATEIALADIEGAVGDTLITRAH